MVQADQITEPFCYWSGTAPACAGACETGEFVASTSKFGDGKIHFQKYPSLIK
jgi:hypothetical protein